MSPTRKARGAATERHTANHLANNGWPYATVTRGPGTDITGVPAWGLEVKARRAFAPLAWIRQARRHPAPNHACIIRPDGSGPEHIGDWLFVMRFDDAIRLMHEAGYGTPPVADAPKPRAQSQP
jgi:hypothetical protein